MKKTNTITILIVILASIALPSSAKDFAVLNNATILLNASGGTGNVILVPGTGNVSIGASAPAAKLHVGGDALIDNKSAVSSTTWTDAVGTPATFDGTVMSLAVYNGQLYALEYAGNVYRYDGGTTWTDVMGTPATISSPTSLAVYNGQLYAGAANGNVYRYDGGTTWTDVMGTPATIGNARSLTVYNGQLYAGDDTGGTTGNVYRYDGGTTWTDVMGTPANISDVYSLAVYNGQLYAGDNGGNVYRYDGGTTWTDVMGTPATISTVHSLVVYNGQLYAGDDSNVYRYDGGTTWTDVVGTPATISTVRFFAVYNGPLYAGGGSDVYSYSANPPQSYALKFKSENETASLWFQGNMSSGQSIEGQNQHGQFIFSHGIQTQSGAYDVAEEFPTYDTTLEAGDIAAASLVNSEFIEKSTASYQKNLIGVVSTKPAVVLKSEQAGDMRLISLAGRVPVKVSTENGVIQVGDYVTSSSIAGVGMKATKAGSVIGRALESFEPKNCAPVNSLDRLVWPADHGTNPSKPCFRFNSIYAGKILAVVDISYNPVDSSRSEPAQMKTSFGNAARLDSSQPENSNLISKLIGSFSSLLSWLKGGEV